MNSKISFYGLSASGKSCFIFAMSQALSQGIELSDGELMTVISPDPRQTVKLYNAYQSMVQGRWPAGNVESVTYNFNVRKALELMMKIEISDYRGALLDSYDEDDADEQNKLFNSYKDSAVLLFFLGADKVMEAMDGDMHARFNFQHFNSLYEQYLETSPEAKKTPVMIIISKADMLTPGELTEAYSFVKKQMAQFFAPGTGLTTGLTSISLGSNLTNENGELEGVLDIRATAGNLSIPIMFSLYNIMANQIASQVGDVESTRTALNHTRAELNEELSRSPFMRFFSDNEGSIRERIKSQTSSLDNKREELLKMNSSMSAIKRFLLHGAELYDNGKRL